MDSGKTSARLVSLFATVILAGAVSPLRGGERSADDILDQFDEVQYPNFLQGLDTDEFQRRVDDSARRQCALALELRQRFPDHPEVPRVMAMRWALLRNTLGDFDALFQETTETLNGDISAGLNRAAHYGRAFAALELESVSQADRIRFVEAAIAVAPDDHESAAALLVQLAKEHVSDPDAQKKLIARVLRSHAGSRAAREAVDLYQVLKHIGGDVRLDFADALTGRLVSAADFRGRKVIVYSFDEWAMTRHGRREVFDRIERLRTGRRRDQFVVLGVMTDRGDTARTALEEHAEQLHIDWPVFRDVTERFDEGWAWDVGLRSTGLFLLLDENGRLAGVSQRLETIVGPTE